MINITYDNFGGKSQILEDLTSLIKEKTLSTSLNFTEIQLTVVDKIVFYIFNKIAEIQGYGNLPLKKVTYDENEMKANLDKLYKIRLKEELLCLGDYDIALGYKLDDCSKILGDCINESILEFSNMKNGINPNMKALKEKEDSPERKAINEFNAQSKTSAEAMQLRIEFISGELLVKDWFRLKEFEDILNEANRGNGSLNDYGGCFKRTKSLAEKCNMLAVSIGDIDPNIYQKEDTIVFGFKKHNAKTETDFNELGSVYVGTWAVSVIDKQEMINLISQSYTMSEETAREKVDAYINEKGIQTLKVNPGIYQFTCSTDFERLSSEAKNEMYKLPKTPGLKPWITLEKIELKLENNLKVKKHKLH